MKRIHIQWALVVLIVAGLFCYGTSYADSNTIVLTQSKVQHDGDPENDKTQYYYSYEYDETPVYLLAAPIARLPLLILQ